MLALSSRPNLRGKLSRSVSGRPPTDGPFMVALPGRVVIVRDEACDRIRRADHPGRPLRGLRAGDRVRYNGMPQTVLAVIDY